MQIHIFTNDKISQISERTQVKFHPSVVFRCLYAFSVAQLPVPSTPDDTAFVDIYVIAVLRNTPKDN